MGFVEVIRQARALLQSEGRLTYRTLKLQFQLDDEHFDALKEELLYSHPQIVDDAGRGLIWNGEREETALVPQPALAPSQTPATYTPQHLAERIRAEQQAMELRGASDGERKTITALFADLKGSTALIEGLDPEEARAIIDPALQLMMDAVHRYEGYVAQALGDGIFALFGAPIAHEDHPQRAVYAALRMQEEMRRYADTLREQGHPPLLMRVGMNTGEVVVRSIRKDDLHADYVPVGHSTNLAARMEQLAAPGSILVSEYTHKLIDGYFTFKDMGKTQIKGVDEPLNVYEVTGAGPLRTRLQVSARRGLTRFVGRHNEMDQLQQALEQAKASHGQIVGVMGEPGLGKSRLFHEFVGAYCHTPSNTSAACLVLQAFAVSHGQSSPYLPLIELLKDYFQIEPSDDERTRKEKINGKVLTLDRSLEDILPYLFSLLGIEDPESSLQQMDAQIRRTRTFEALKQLFLRESLNQPLILIVEDLHWIDSETQGFLDALTDSVASAQLLLLTNYRPEYRHEWGAKTYYTQVRLTPLGETEAEEFLTFLLGTDTSLTSIKKLVLERTDGTPFFMEEVVQELVEQGMLVPTDGGAVLCDRPPEGALTGAPLQIPPTVQGVLAARIDRLTTEEKTLLQQLSVIGRQFPISLVKQVVSQPETDLYRVLSSLQAKEFLYEQPAFPESQFIFKHALTRDVASGTVLQEQRKALHEQTGQAIEVLYAEKLHEHYNELAHHYSQSGNAEKAVEYLYQAGQQAAERSVYEEAIRYLRQGLDLLTALPDTHGSQRHELRMQLALGPAVSATKGYAAPAAEHAYVRARELSNQLGDSAQQFAVLHGLWMIYYVQGELLKAQEVTTQMLQLAERDPDSSFLSDTHFLTGWILFNLGQLRLASTHLERSLTLHNPEDSSIARYGVDSGVRIQTYTSNVLWMLGYPDGALSHAQEALARAQAISHPESFLAARSFAAFVYQWRREPHAVQPLTEAILTHGEEQGSSYWEGWGRIQHGWVFVDRGEGQAGIAQFQKGWSLYEATGARWVRSYVLASLAEAYRQVGQFADGLTAVSDALAHVEATQERFYEAELYRLQGELTLQKPKAGSQQSKVEEEAETCFHTAVAIARKQQAKSWELRAATSLARLWQGQGKTQEAHDLLAPVYNWFTEGFDTADLKDAKALLDEPP